VLRERMESLIIEPLGCDRFQHVRHRRRFPFAPRAVASAVESGCDGSRRLRPSGLSLSNDRQYVSACASAPTIRLALMSAHASARRGLPGI
jgi:hypothetical protein